MLQSLMSDSLGRKLNGKKYRGRRFLLNKIKNFKTSSSFRQLRKIRRWYKKQQKDKRPRIKRIKPLVTIFERDYN